MRMDKQVKIRGARVQLDEIANEIVKYPGIQECAIDFRNKQKDKWNASKCVKCGIPSTYPGVEFDGNGACSVCGFYEEHKEKAEPYFKELKGLEALCKGDSEKNYDCLLLYSGGKDSTYVLYKLVDMGFKVLTYTFDNGFISETALDNIKNVVKELNVDYIIDSYERMNEIFLCGLKEELSVCNGCFKVLRIKSTRLAYEKGIKNIVTGFSRGQIFELRLSDIFRLGIYDINKIEKRLFEQRLFYHYLEDYVTSYIDENMRVDVNMLRETQLIDFYRYTDVSKKEIYDFLKSRNDYWKNPDDTGFCSSNCMINDVGIFIQRKERGYDNYTYPNSWEVRTGHMSLEESDSEYEGLIDTQRVERILEELGYNQEKENDGYSDV